MKKKKLKLKKINFFIFLIIIFFIVFFLTLLLLSITNNKSKKITKTVVEKKDNLDSKLKKLDYINKKINYFDNSKIDRYINYKKKNKNISNKQVVIDVNIGLDFPYYENINEAINKNTNIILVNKYYFLDENYVPKNLEKLSLDHAQEGMMLVKDAKNAFEEMASDAEKENLNIIVLSSYRSYSYQVNLYNKYKKKDGIKEADLYSGRPGHSEHQTGLAIDVYDGELDYTNFEKTLEFEWMMKNAHKYGFILRFPKNKEKETGYIYESWHYRYVGKHLANILYKNNYTLEEYYATKKKISN